MNCQRVRKEIKALIDGELGPVARYRVTRHIARCDECRKEMAEMSDLTARVKNASEIAAPEGLRGRVLGKLELKPRVERVRKWWPYKTSPAAVAGVLLVTVVMAAVLFPIFSRSRGASQGSRVQGSLKRIGAAVTLARNYPAEAKAVPASPPMHETRAKDKSGAMSGGEQYGGAQSPAPAMPSPNLLIIKTADMSLQVKSFQDAYDQAVSIAKSTGGYVTDSSAETTGTAPTSGQVTMKIPVDAFERTINRLSSLGKVLSKSISGEDVSGEAVDLESRIRNKRAEERQYLDIMNRAKRVSDIVTVSNELYRVRGEIEEAAGRLKYLRSASAMSTINLSLADKEKPKPAPRSGLSRTWSDATGSLVATGRAITGLVIWLAVYSPFWALPIAAWLFLKKREGREQRAES